MRTIKSWRMESNKGRYEGEVVQVYIARDCLRFAKWETVIAANGKPVSCWTSNV